MRLQVRSLASLRGLRIRRCHEPWCRSQTQLGSGVAVAPMRPLAWEPPYAADVAVKRQKKGGEAVRKLTRWLAERQNHPSLQPYFMPLEKVSTKPYGFLYFLNFFIFLFLFLFFIFNFLRHMGVSGSGTESKLRLLTYTAAMATLDPLTYCASWGANPHL